MTCGTEPLRQAITGVPVAMASIMTRPNGSGQSIGKEQCKRIAEKLIFFMVADFANEFDQRVVE